MINVQFAALPERWASYEAPLRTAFQNAGLEVDLRLDHAPSEVDYVVYAPNSDLQDFSHHSRCKAVLSLWAGVEKITGNSTLTMPLCRMVDPGLTAGMVEWVTGHVLRYHLDIDRSLAEQDRWNPIVPPLARERPITMLGLGALGTACAQALVGLGFPVTGWSRSAKDIPNINCLHGEDGLKEALRTAEIVILLLPDTAATENTLDAETLAMLPKGARIINPGRGPLVDDDALLAALETGQIGHATLDVFRVEPLPQDHPYWGHPNVTVTPHIAAETRASTAAEVIAENLRRGEAGEPFLHQVDRQLGY
ncbi:D-isomer specific 2-hydroxyacid dehydrogenase family protein [Roseobacter sp. SK209-2-6]|uniref:2-hydroxyacid dehydrogenase n=1 Tax=Roseobacter sp. SK209-2-6 TaxID=388739 RepID=UPI0000F3C64E|nr:glyoxylate/hydroxypyruvate reductase A [Roseobacter sp. SK209-2-6]EBA18750.1 D-isomer specific 2-hydroxyacid dehydrogenase family protein [Roseobacter sp. SK209-2-6]